MTNPSKLEQVAHKGWAQVTDINPAAEKNWAAMWRTDGWQINLSKEPKERPYFLIDSNMPWGIPASAFHGSFSTFAEAVQKAGELGPMDWSDYWQEFGE